MKKIFIFTVTHVVVFIFGGLITQEANNKKIGYKIEQEKLFDITLSHAALTKLDDKKFDKVRSLLWTKLTGSMLRFSLYDNIENTYYPPEKVRHTLGKVKDYTMKNLEEQCSEGHKDNVKKVLALLDK